MPNRLIDSASPYLLQHADNPVEWWEWCEDAFDEARQRDVPVLISVGYSACHWCHVMAHESFEDVATATQMNASFVNIKVDREERPDVDAVYMEATQAMTGSGGWPMTVFADHSGAPFFTGTYFPPSDRHGMPGFRTVLTAVSDAWQTNRAQVDEQASRLADAIGRRLPVADDLPGEETLAAAISAITAAYDPHHGGFGGAPKFPQQPVLEFLLRVHDRPWAGAAADIVRHSLAAMAAGGIRDHLGGGFARYTVDDHWLVPHFEKMLYDNAQLARIYLWAGIEFESPSLIAVATEALEYLVTDLSHPEGGFFAAEDADSEGVEGKFYVWSHEEFAEVTGDDSAVAGAYFGVTPEGNFEGATILHRSRGIDEVANDFDISLTEATDAVRRAGAALLERRSSRVRPGLDDKVVAAWNGLAIRAFADAGAVLDEPRYVTAAVDAALFVLERLVDDSGRLHRSWAKDRIGPVAVLDDYGAMALGFFALYSATGDDAWFEHGISLTRRIPELFADTEGGFFTTASDAESLIIRPKAHFDNPLPSGNSLAAEALLLAAAFTGDARLRSSAEHAVRASAAILERAPTGAGRGLAVLAGLLGGSTELAVVGPNAAELVKVAFERFRPAMAVAWSPGDNLTVPLLKGRFRSHTTLAYLCRDFVCDAPVAEPEALRQLLADR